MSGFLLWQGAYSELIFMDVYWPAFRKIDLLQGDTDLPEAAAEDGQVAPQIRLTDEPDQEAEEDAKVDHPLLCVVHVPEGVLEHREYHVEDGPDRKAVEDQVEAPWSCSRSRRPPDDRREAPDEEEQTVSSRSSCRAGRRTAR